VSLALDGVTGGVQDKLRAEHKTQTYRMMLWMNLWSVLYLAIGKCFKYFDFFSLRTYSPGLIAPLHAK